MLMRMSILEKGEYGMRGAWGVALLVGAGLLAGGCSEESESFDKRGSYALGVDVGNSLMQLQANIDLDELVEGLLDVLSDREPEMTGEELQETLTDFLAKAREDNARRMAEASEENMQEGEAFLAENRTKEGVTETESGLQYMVLEQGDGPSPVATDRVTVHYEGRLLDGTVFDSSYERNEPAAFAVDRVIAGWTEAVQLMNVGGKFRLFIPSNLAYGERGAGQDIGPNATLIFDVELLGIEQ
jgi:FKBP-type peptidyl-prolyl cis-trans isomerase FklB